VSGPTRRIFAVASREAQFQFASPLLGALAVAAAFATLAINPAAMVPTGQAAVGGVAPFANAPLALAQAMALSGLIFYTFPATLLGGQAALRDDEAGVGPLLHATPLRAGEYVAGKLAGVVAALGAVAFGHALLIALWHLAAGALGARLAIGPMSFAAYGLSALLFLGPGLVLCAVVGFGLGERTRSPLAVYAAASALFALGLAGLVPRPPSMLDASVDGFFALADPWGARWLSRTVFAVDRGAAWFNATSLPFDAGFWLCRAALAAGCATIVVAAMRHCERVVRGRETRRSPPGAAFETPTAARLQPPRGVPAMRRPPGALEASLFLARAELAQLVRQPGAWIFAAFLCLLVLEHSGATRGVLESPVRWTPGLLATSLVPTLTAASALFLLFTLTDALDCGSRTRAAAVVQATPVPTSALLLGPAIATQLALAAVLAAGALGVVLRSSGGPAWPLPFVWGVLLGPTFAAWTAAVLLGWTLTRSRARTIALGLGLLLLTASAHLQDRLEWWTNWPLWGVLRWSGTGPPFELVWEPLLLNRLLFTALAAALAILAIERFPRPEADRLHARHGFRRVRGLGVALCIAGLAGGRLAHGVVEGPDGSAARDRDADYWRLNVAAWSGAPLSTLEALDARIDLHPAEGRGSSVPAVRVSGRYQLRNEGQAPLEALPFTLGPAARSVRWTLAGASVAAEDRAGLFVVRPAPALAVGATVEAGFDYELRTGDGYRRGGETVEFVLPSSVQLDTLGRHLLPVPGFVAGVGESPERRHEPAPWPVTRPGQPRAPIQGNPRPFRSRLEITAPPGLSVVATGEKTAEFERDGRRVTVWESGPVGVRFVSVAAGSWATRERGGAAVYHDPSLGPETDEVLAALSTARERYSEWFGAYPWSRLRLAVMPDHATRARAFPTLVHFSEGMGLFAGEGPGAPAAAIVTAHEAAHQWWGHQLTPAAAPGADVLLEGLAHYSTLLWLESERGADARQAFARYLEEQYASRRRVDLVRPLVALAGRGAHERSAAENRGAWGFWMLDRQLGRERMLAGLRDLIARYRGGPDHPTLEDALALLRVQAGDAPAFDRVADFWFRRTDLPELELKVVRSAELASGRHELVVAVAGAAGLEVALAAVGAAGERLDVPLRAGEARWVLPFAPVRVVADPDVHLLQLHRSRAVKELR
jgi:ABC-2 type transport system permease protein